MDRPTHCTYNRRVFLKLIAYFGTNSVSSIEISQDLYTLTVLLYNISTELFLTIFYDLQLLILLRHQKCCFTYTELVPSILFNAIKTHLRQTALNKGCVFSRYLPITPNVFYGSL